MSGSLKNSSFVKSSNFPQQKLKMPGIKIWFNKKMHPSMDSQPSLLLLMDCVEFSPLEVGEVKGSTLLIPLGLGSVIRGGSLPHLPSLKHRVY